MMDPPQLEPGVVMAGSSFAREEVTGRRGMVRGEDGLFCVGECECACGECEDGEAVERLHGCVLLGRREAREGTAI